MPQSVVNTYLGSGIPGEFYDDSPKRVKPYIVNSVTQTNNVFGSCFSILSEGVVQAGNPSGTAVFAGFLVDPKSVPLFGVAGSPLSPSFYMPNNNNVQIADMCQMWVSLLGTNGPGNIGNTVIYRETDGVVDSIAPNTAVPAGWLYANASVILFNVASGLAAIRVTTVP